MSQSATICVCRALYDYTSGDASSLSFAAGDDIQVFTILDSGWWDGVCRGERGWFPSNYVQVLSATDPLFPGYSSGSERPPPINTAHTSTSSFDHTSNGDLVQRSDSFSHLDAFPNGSYQARVYMHQ
jgi:hypothetical protein